MKSIFEEAICQLCLKVDIKVYKISDVQHVFIESILKLNDIHYVPSENLSVCSICMALLVKTFNFVQTVWKAQEVVYDLLQNIKMITKSSVRGLNRHRMGLNPLKLKLKTTSITKAIYDVCEFENLDNNNTLDVDPEEHRSIITMIKQSEDNFELSCKKKDVIDVNGCDEELCDIDHSNNTNSPSISVIKINSQTLDTKECDSIKEYNEVRVISNHEDDSNNPKDTILSVIKTNPVILDVGAIEYDSTKNYNVVPVISNHEDDSNNTKDAILPDIKTNPVTLDLGTIECDSLSKSNEALAGISHDDDSNGIKEPLIRVVEANFDTEDVDEIEYDSLNKSNETATGISHEDGIDTNDPLLPVVEANLVTEDLGVIEYNSNEAPKVIIFEDDANNTNDPLLTVTKSNPVILDVGGNTTQVKKKKIKKKKVLKKMKEDFDLDYESPSEDEKKQLEKDGNYSPAEDSTSHSEDSAYDDFDDTGRKIKKPSHGLAYPRKCDNCNYEIPQHNMHFKHYLFMHPDIPYPYGQKKDYACSVCGKLMTAAKINTHERGHIKRKLKCPKCPKIFSNDVKLYYHMKRVHPKQIFICDYCSKKFKTRSDLCRHLRTHTGTKPYQCHVCDAAFAHSGNRIIHIRSKHQNIKYVPKKQAKKAEKARSKNRHNSYDTDKSSDEEIIKRKKRGRPSSKSKSKNNVESNKKKSKGMKKKKPNVEKENCKKNNKNAITVNRDTDSESDDEVLSVIKRRKTSNE
uniref:C2H2-type domain-containing protein n=1 Tax=Heliothis virescens TaxID=7102 RepID=A0A2A4KA71_HELVI